MVILCGGHNKIMANVQQVLKVCSDIMLHFQQIRGYIINYIINAGVFTMCRRDAHVLHGE